MKTKNYLPLLVATWFLVIACGLGSTVAQATPTPAFGLTSLWPDVPLFPGAAPDPAASFLNQFNKVSPAMMTMIFYTDRQSADVAAFYSDDMMKGQGWTPQPYAVVKWFSVGEGQGPQIHDNFTSGGCQTGTRNGQPIAYCTFSKTDDTSQDVELTITITPDQKNSGQVMITYVRMTGSNSNSNGSAVTPTP